MKYQVVWSAEAEADLARVWLAAPDRSAVTEAITQLERRLIASPLIAGESRESNLRRVAFEPPIAVSFVVTDNSVGVIAVWFFAKRTQ